MRNDVMKTIMKLANKKSKGFNQVRTVLDRSAVGRPFDSFKVLHIFRNQSKINLATTISTSRIEELEKLRIEVELERDQGKIYAAFLPPR